MEKKVLSKEQIEKESAERNFEEVFKKQPTKAGVLKTLKERSKEYKDANTYEDAMKILEKRRPAAHRRISEHIEPDHPLEHADDATIDKELAERGLSQADLEAAKNKEIEAKKAELLKPEAKATELKQEQPKKASSRWTEADENARPGSKKIIEEPKKTEKPEKQEKEKKEKKPTHFRKNTWGGIKRLAKVPNRLRRTI